MGKWGNVYEGSRKRLNSLGAGKYTNMRKKQGLTSPKSYDNTQGREGEEEERAT